MTDRSITLASILNLFSLVLEIEGINEDNDYFSVSGEVFEGSNCEHPKTGVFLHIRSEYLFVMTKRRANAKIVQCALRAFEVEVLRFGECLQFAIDITMEMLVFLRKKMVKVHSVFRQLIPFTQNVFASSSLQNGRWKNFLSDCKSPNSSIKITSFSDFYFVIQKTANMFFRLKILGPRTWRLNSFSDFICTVITDAVERAASEQNWLDCNMLKRRVRGDL